MDSAERSCVFFDRPGLGLDEAEAALRQGGLAVSRKGDVLHVGGNGGPELFVRVVRGEGARRDAARLGRGEPLDAVLRRCDAAFVITFRDLDEVLEEADALTDVQLRLQKLTDGVIARSWNDELSGPEREGT
jgi:hypothetical protein